MAKTISQSFTLTVSGGTGSTTTADFLPMNFSGGKIKRIVVIPPDEAANHTFSIEDATSGIYKMGSKTGTYIADREVTFEKGTHTLKFDNETTDGIFIVRGVFELDW